MEAIVSCGSTTFCRHIGKILFCEEFQSVVWNTFIVLQQNSKSWATYLTAYLLPVCASLYWLLQRLEHKTI